MASISLGSHVWINALGVQQLLTRPLSYRLFQKVNTKAPFEVVDSWCDRDGQQYCLLASAEYPVGKRPEVGWVDAGCVRLILHEVASLEYRPLAVSGD